MKPLGVILGLLLSASATAAPTPPETGRCVEGQVTAVGDGDTLTVTAKYSFRVRLKDCWAPEIHGPQKPEGIKSLQNLQAIALGRKCRVFIPEDAADIGQSTSLSRYIGEVWVNDINLSEEQVAKKFACKTKQECLEKYGPARIEKDEE